MRTDKKTHELSVFLVKKSFDRTEEILNVEQCEPSVSIDIPGHESAHLFIKRGQEKPPKWSFLFRKFVDPKSLETHGISAALLIATNGRIFVLSFGQGGRFLLREDVCEERFGLICALNSVDLNSFRCVDVQSLDAIQSHTRIQSGQETTPDQFGLDVEQDMLKAIVGSPIDVSLGSRMAGSDSLSVSVKMDVSDLPRLLNAYRDRFEAELSDENYQWVNNISVVKESSVIRGLEVALEEKFANNDYANVWLSIPGIINWDSVVGFMYSGGRRVVHPDINLQGFLETVKGKAVTVELLHQRTVACADADHQELFKRWSIHKCLYAEIDQGDQKFILNDGKWFRVATDFVERTLTDFERVQLSSLKLPIYRGKGEGAYNASVVAAEPARYALLDDKKKVMHGGGHGQVEICDLFSIDRHLVHVKIYGKSSILSHLFAQGFVSGQLIQIDSEFRKKVKMQLNAPFSELIEVERKPLQDEFTVVFAVISDASGDRPHLPFFSRVNLNNTVKVLKGFGFKVELLKIDVDESYSKTKLIPPSRQRGSRGKGVS